MTRNWKSYYKNEHVQDYNLKEYKDKDLEIKLFNTNDREMEGDYQINYLNPYLGELPMMYYIWKNNLESEFITISQYRREISYVDYDIISNDGAIQLTYQWDEDEGVKLKDRLLIYRDPTGTIKEKIYEFLKEHYSLSNEELEDIRNRTTYRCMACFVWSMNWKTFCDLCSFIFGILDKLLPNDGWKDVDTILNFREEQKKLYYEKYPDRYDWIFDNNRYLTYIMEDTLSVILGQFFILFGNNKYWDETYILTHVNKENTTKEVSKWFKLNMKANPFEVFVCCDDECFDEYYTYFMKDFAWEHDKIKIIKNIDEVTQKCICLNINQYIDLNTPLDLYNNKYIIKNINV